MLSRENQSKLSETELAIAWREANGAARGLAKALILGERHPDPHAERNAPNPAHGVTRIRLIRPQPAAVWVDDADDVKDHNSFVGSLGREGTKFQ